MLIVLSRLRESMYVPNMNWQTSNDRCLNIVRADWISESSSIISPKYSDYIHGLWTVQTLFHVVPSLFLMKYQFRALCMFEYAPIYILHFRYTYRVTAEGHVVVSEVCKFGIWCSVMKPHVQISLHYFTSSQGRGILCDYHNQMEIKRLIGSIRRQLHLQQWGRDLLLENRVTPAPGLTIMSEKTIVLSSVDEEDDNHCWPSKLSGRLFPLSFIYYYLFQNIRSFIYVLSSMFSTDPSSRLFVVPFWSTVWFMV
jgi:hypothetical protein